MQLAVALELDTQIKAMASGLTVTAVIPTLTLVSADDELNTAAMTEGLIVENPRTHP